MERIWFDQLRKKLNTADKASSAWVTGSEILINWSVVIAMKIVRVVIISAVWAPRKREKVILKQKATVSARSHGSGEPFSVLLESKTKKADIKPLVETTSTVEKPKVTEHGRITGNEKS